MNDVNKFLEVFKMTESQIYNKYKDKLDKYDWKISQDELNSSGLVGKNFKDEYEFYKYISILSINNKDIYRIFLRIIDILDMTYSHLDIKFEDIFLGNPNLDGCEELAYH
jgi:hypothetical protein